MKIVELRTVMVAGKGHPVLHVELTRRNLLALLAKLEVPGSACSLSKTDDNVSIIVTSVPDAEHYNDREPGAVHPDTAAVGERKTDTLVSEAIGGVSLS